ncbi:hypothetical protein [Cypionkella psychrotolerans]|nr:hypothetical protein [Cypionkella psychrotolerans]
MPALNAAVDGLGLAHVPEDLARPYLVDGRLIEVLTVRRDGEEQAVT